MRKRARPISSDPGLIVVADADGAAARLLAMHLTSRGLKAVHARAGRKVLSLARSGGLRLAVVDAALADMPGYALAARLRELDPRLPILMTSADHRPELEIQARRLGVLYYAHKPVTSERVEAVVSRALGRGRGSAPGPHESTRARGRGRG